MKCFEGKYRTREQKSWRDPWSAALDRRQIRLLSARHSLRFNFAADGAIDVSRVRALAGHRDDVAERRSPARSPIIKFRGNARALRSRGDTNERGVPGNPIFIRREGKRLWLVYEWNRGMENSDRKWKAANNSYRLTVSIERRSARRAAPVQE